MFRVAAGSMPFPQSYIITIGASVSFHMAIPLMGMIQVRVTASNDLKVLCTWNQRQVKPIR